MTGVPASSAVPYPSASIVHFPDAWSRWTTLIANPFIPHSAPTFSSQLLNSASNTGTGVETWPSLWSSAWTGEACVNERKGRSQRTQRMAQVERGLWRRMPLNKWHHMYHLRAQPIALVTCSVRNAPTRSQGEACRRSHMRLSTQPTPYSSAATQRVAQGEAE